MGRVVSAIPRRWAVREPSAAACASVALEIDRAYPKLARSSRWLATFLANRGIDDPEAALAFLGATLATDLRSPRLVTDMHVAAMRLADAIRGGEPIVVYADYDVDGITGAAAFLLFLRELGVEPGLYVPNRVREGYGLHEAAIREIAAQGARVLVTVDCGTANVQELRLAAELGLDVIVCDHHHTPAERPPAFAVLNPHRADCTFPFKGLSGAGVVFYLLMGLRMELRERGVQPLPDLRRYLDLVALGTIADMVPLREENRVLVRYGLRELDRSTRPGIAALRELTATGAVTAQAVSFRLAPVLNAGGRLADARRAVELLTTAVSSEAQDLARGLCDDNRERRAIEQRIAAEAVTMVERDGLWRRRATIVVGSETWHAGVVGIVAARLVERFYRPAFVFALGKGLARGSGRSIRDLHLVEALSECREHLVSFGGHRAAAGASLRAEDLPKFSIAFEASVQRRTTPASFLPRLEIDAEIHLDEVSRELVGDLEVLEPTGQSNPAPTLVAKGVEVLASRTVGSPIEHEGVRVAPHLRLTLRQDRLCFGAIGFGMSALAPAVGARVDVVFTPEMDTWGRDGGVSLRLIDLRVSES